MALPMHIIELLGTGSLSYNATVVGQGGSHTCYNAAKTSTMQPYMELGEYPVWFNSHYREYSCYKQWLLAIERP